MMRHYLYYIGVANTITYTQTVGWRSPWVSVAKPTDKKNIKNGEFKNEH